MDASLSVPLFVGFAFVTVGAVVLLRKTRLFWLPGAALIAYACAIWVAWPWYDTRGDVSMFRGFSNFMHVVVSFSVVAWGVVCLIVGARSRKRAQRARTTDIPTAIVKKDSGAATHL